MSQSTVRQRRENRASLTAIAAWIAGRYIRNQRSVQFTGIIAALSLVGITIGVAAVICVASIFLGFRHLFEEMMLRIDPHLRIVSRIGKFLPDLDSVLQLMPASCVAAPVLDGKVVALHGRAVHVMQLRGVSATALARVPKLAEVVLVGHMPTRPQQIVLAAGAAARLGALPGDTLLLLSPELLSQAAIGMGLPLAQPVLVSGLALTNDRTYDNTLAITQLPLAAELFNADTTTATALDIYCPSTAEALELAQLLRTKLDGRYRLLTWRDLHREMYAVMEWERVASFLLLSLIVLIAVFNIVAMLTMTVISKQRDIAVLRTLGAPPSMVAHIFRWQGVIIGAVGTALGTALGLGLCFGQQQFHWILLSTDQYIMQELPVRIDWAATVAAICISLASSALASAFPARRATQTPIAPLLRYE